MSNDQAIIDNGDHLLPKIEAGDVDAMFEYADFLETNQYYDLSVEYFKMAATNGNKKAYSRYARSLDIKGDMKEAKKYYELAIENGNTIAMNNLAVIYEKENNFFEAERYYKKGIEGMNTYAMENYGKLLMKYNKYDDAKQYILRAIELGRDDLIHYYCFFVVTDEGEHFENFSNLVPRSSKVNDVLNNLSYRVLNNRIVKRYVELLIEEKKLDSAKKYLSRVLYAGNHHVIDMYCDIETDIEEQYYIIDKFAYRHELVIKKLQELKIMIDEKKKNKPIQKKGTCEMCNTNEVYISQVEASTMSCDSCKIMVQIF